MTFKCLIPGSWSIAVDFRTPLNSQSFLAYWPKMGLLTHISREKWKYDVHTQDIQMPGIIFVWSSMVFQTLKSSFWCLRSCVASSCFGFASLPARFLSPHNKPVTTACWTGASKPQTTALIGLYRNYMGFAWWALVALLLHIAMTRRHRPDRGYHHGPPHSPLSIHPALKVGDGRLRWKECYQFEFF